MIRVRLTFAMSSRNPGGQDYIRLVTPQHFRQKVAISRLVLKLCIAPVKGFQKVCPHDFGGVFGLYGTDFRSTSRTHLTLG